MAKVREATHGNQSLSVLQTVVQQQEGIFGPLVGLSTEGSQNIMEFLIGPSPDAGHRIFLLAYSDHPPRKEGHTLICISPRFVDGVLKHVGAYRPLS